MNEIFIGSTSEAIRHIEQMAACFVDAGGVKALLWMHAFEVGAKTFLAIEEGAGRAAGAVFLVTPDDDSIVRNRKVKVPRANGLVEYGESGLDTASTGIRRNRADHGTWQVGRTRQSDTTQVRDGLQIAQKEEVKWA